MIRPILFKSPVAHHNRWHDLYLYITKSVQELERGERVKDFEHYVFEAAMEAVYGPDVWADYNELVDGE